MGARQKTEHFKKGGGSLLKFVFALCIKDLCKVAAVVAVFIFTLPREKNVMLSRLKFVFL